MEKARDNSKSTQRLASLLRAHPQRSNIVLACAVGLLVGVVSIAFHELLHFVQILALGAASPLVALAVLPWYWKVGLPTIGGLLVAPIVYRWAVEAKGHGVPEVMEAVALRGGLIRARVAFAKAMASAITIGTGGSVGREGPVVQIGSALGSLCGQRLPLSPEQVKTLVGCGAAGGIAATFNAPIAGAFFALEVILGNFAVPAFAPIILSSVVATAVSRAYLGNFPAFRVPHYSLVHYSEVPLYALLGIVTGLVAVGFIWVLYKTEDLFERSPIPPMARTTIGGLAVGACLLVTPEVYGTGFEVMDRLLHETIAWQYLALLLLMKLTATCLTLGSGASGGIFSPSLFFGGLAGGLFGHGAHALFPDAIARPEAYAMVGMGAVVAGTTHAPVTAILMLFELTGDYAIILPVMVACTLSTLTARYCQPYSIYSLKLARKGVVLSQGREETVMRSFHVADVMHTPAPALSENASFPQVVEKVLSSQDPHYYLVNDEHQLTGVIYMHDAKEFLSEGGLDNLVVAGDLARPVSATASPGETLAECLHKFSATGLERLPVVQAAPDARLVGIVTQADLLELYDREVLRKEFLGATTMSVSQGRSGLTLPPQYTIEPFVVPPALVGKTLQALDFRARYHATVVAFRTQTMTGPRDYLPQADEPLQAETTLILAGRLEDIARLRRAVNEAPETEPRGLKA